MTPPVAVKRKRPPLPPSSSSSPAAAPNKRKKIPQPTLNSPENSNNNNKKINNLPHSSPGSSYLNENLTQAQLPIYLLDAFEEIYTDDGLLVLGRGLGLLPLLASYIRFLSDVEHGYLATDGDDNDNNNGRETTAKDLKSCSRQPPLVFVLGMNDTERQSLMDILQSWGTPRRQLPTVMTTDTGQGGNQRMDLYRQGGIYLITTRLLIVDLLTYPDLSRLMNGCLVTHAETVTESSTISFIIRLYKQCGNKGFVKGFTDNPVGLMSGAFAKVDKIMKCLYVRRLILYPRFHERVRQELEQFEPKVEELHVQLTPLMKEIQGAIAVAVQTCIREIKKATSLIEWTSSDLTLENCVTTNFDRAISRQLEHDWHRLSPSTKQLVNDLRTLRTLFRYLIQYDCITFYKLLQNIRSLSSTSRHPSLWLLTPAADLLYRKAKERLYDVTLPTTGGGVGSITARLEDNPKWTIVHRVLSEIKQKQQSSAETNNINDRSFIGGVDILIMVKDNRTLEYLRSHLVDDPNSNDQEEQPQPQRRTTMLRWLRYLEKVNDRSRRIMKNHGHARSLTEENRLLLEEEQRIRRILFGNNKSNDRGDNNKGATTSESKQKPSTNDNTSGTSPDDAARKKRQKVQKEMHRGDRNVGDDDLEQRAILSEALALTQQDLDDEMIEDCENDDSNDNGKSTTIDENDNQDEDAASFDDDDDDPYHISLLPPFHISIRTYPSSDNERELTLLRDLSPTHVILYDSQPSFIRALEIHANRCCCSVSSSQRQQLNVYLLLYSASAEERQFLTSITAERDAFERLVRHKMTMPPIMHTVISHATQEMLLAAETGKDGGSVAGTYGGGRFPLSVDTRTGRGKLGVVGVERRRVIVDVREFRSELPSVLHQGGMTLHPLTLTIGDFILTNSHAIERKSITDLFSSFATGRLYTQATQLSKYYSCPCLLIEFDPTKSFALQNINDLGSDVKSESICSKMALLCMHFPKLRLLWSRSTKDTLRIFKSLKSNHCEPDVERALKMGSEESVDSLLLQNDDADDDGAATNKEENKVNEAARDILLRLPGVTAANARKIMSECDCLADLADMGRERLKEMLGPLTGQRLFTFFRQTVID